MPLQLKQSGRTHQSSNTRWYRCGSCSQSGGPLLLLNRGRRRCTYGFGSRRNRLHLGNVIGSLRVFWSSAVVGRFVWIHSQLDDKDKQYAECQYCVLYSAPFGFEFPLGLVLLFGVCGFKIDRL